MLSSILGMFGRPALTFRGFRENPAWLAPFVVTAVCVCVFSLLTYQIQGQESLERMKTSRWAERMPEERLEEMKDAVENPTVGRQILYGAVFPPLGVFIIQILIIGGIGHLLSTLMGGSGTFKSGMCVMSYASVIGVGLGALVTLPFALVKESISSVTFSLAAFIPSLPTDSTAFQVLSTLDVFFVWLLVLGTLGWSEVYGISRGKGFIAAAVPIVGLAVIRIIMSVMM